MPRDQQICLYFSEEEKENLDNLCDSYNLSRPDFVRLAMYIAIHEPVIFCEEAFNARREGWLIGGRYGRAKEK